MFNDIKQAISCKGVNMQTLAPSLFLYALIQCYQTAKAGLDSQNTNTSSRASFI
jgi:hypothetical protein